MSFRKSAAGLSLNKMLDAEPLQAPMQLAMPSRSVRIKPTHDAPIASDFQLMEMSQMAAPTIRIKPTLQEGPPPLIAPYSALSNIAMPMGIAVRPVLNAPELHFNPFELQQQFPPQQQLQQQQHQQFPPYQEQFPPYQQQFPPSQQQFPPSQQLFPINFQPPPPPEVSKAKPNRPARPTLSAPQLLSALKIWCTSLTGKNDDDGSNSGSTSRSGTTSSRGPNSIANVSAEALSHSSNLVCLLTSTQISKELKALQELLDAGYIQPMEFESRRFQLQSMSKYALTEVSVPNIDCNRVLSPMTATSSNSSSLSHTRSRHIRVFVSSTFKDMAEERETLVKNVFPQLQRECKKRGIVLTSVDLRWGITSEQTNAGNTVNICLSEIDRSQYFLCMLGSRYGWAQPSDAPPVDLGSANIASGQDVLLKKSMQLALPNYPWIRSYASASVTELEIRHAVLNRPDQPLFNRSLFMLRSGVVEDDSRLKALKQDINNNARSGSVKNYRAGTSNDDFGATVLQSLLQMILGDFPDDEKLNGEDTPVKKERIPHQAFEDSRCRFFIPRDSDFQALDSHLASMTSKPLTVIAEQGYGKSAFLANFASRYRNDHPERLLITHYVGCTTASADLANLLQRMIGELWQYSRANETNEEAKKETLEIPTEIPALTDKFIELLTAAGSRYGGGVTIVVDAINQLASGRTLEWLPASLPSGVQVVLSTNNSPESSATLARIGAKIFSLEPLSASEREVFIQGFMSLHAKSLKPEQLASLVSPAACANPLYLKTLLEELRVFGSFEQLDQRIADYLKARDATELFQLVFDRLDKDTSVLSPSDIVKSVLSAIYVSRSGLSEEEIIGMFKLPSNVWASVSLALEELLVDSSGQLTFFHDCVRSAVERHYIKGRQKALHDQLANYFASYPLAKDLPPKSNDPNKHRYYEELPYQYEKAENWTKLLQLVTTLDAFETLETQAFRFDLYRYWRALKTSHGDSAASTLITHLEDSSVKANAPRRVELLDKVSLFFKDIGQYQQAEDLLKKAIMTSTAPTEALISNPSTFEDAKKTADRMEKLGYVLRLSGKYAEAAKIYGMSLKAKRLIYKNKDDPFLATSINSLAILNRKQGNYEEASKLYHEALDMRKRLFGQVHVDIAQSFNSLGCLLQDQGRYEEASNMLLEAVRQREMLLGKSHPDVAMSLLNLGNVYLDWSRFTDAVPIYQRSLEIYEATFGPEHPNVALVLNSFGGLYQEMGQFELSIPMYVRNLETKLKLLGHMHPDLALAYNDIAVLCSRKENNGLAEDFFNGALQIRRTVLGDKHPDFAQSLQNLGSVYQEEGLYDMALPLFKQALDINVGSFGNQHPNVASACTSIGGLLQLKGPNTYPEAVTYYKRSLDIYVALCANKKPDSDLALTCNDLAILYVKMGRWKDAEEMYLDALKHYTGCFGPDHADVAQALKNLGSFYLNPACLEKDKAARYLRQSVQVFEATLGHSHARTEAVRALLQRAETM